MFVRTRYPSFRLVRRRYLDVLVRCSKVSACQTVRARGRQRRGPEPARHERVRLLVHLDDAGAEERVPAQDVLPGRIQPPGVQTELGPQPEQRRLEAISVRAPC